MKVAVIIPLWKGEAVIEACLAALYAQSGDELLEVICIDNASPDRAAQWVAAHYSQVRLIRQPINLGFAGGVNAGLDAAQGDIRVLLNQDCIVRPGWLTALLGAFADHPDCGIAGCTILNADGSINHTGGRIRRPDAYGVHLVERGDDQPQRVEYVTGAVFALRQSTWQTVGRFDDGFYPAYYEESDYCYRARRKQIETLHVPQAEATHLISSREWQTDATRHTANQHLSRYRFVAKQFDSREVDEFFKAEIAAVGEEPYFDQALGRTLAARATLRTLPDILERRRVDGDELITPAHRLQLQVGFTQVLRGSFAQAERLSQPAATVPVSATPKQPAVDQFRALQQREYDLVKRIYFKAPEDRRVESLARRLYRLLVLRPLSFLTGREHLLVAELNTVHVARLDQLMAQNLGLQQEAERLERLIELNQQLNQQAMSALARRLKLLELLTDYDYR